MILGVLLLFLTQPTFGSETIYRTQAADRSSLVGQVTIVLQRGNSSHMRLIALRLFKRSADLVAGQQTLAGRAALAAIHWAASNDPASQVRETAAMALATFSHDFLKLDAEKRGRSSSFDLRLELLGSDEFDDLLEASAFERVEAVNDAIYEILFEDVRTRIMSWQLGDNFVSQATSILKLVVARKDLQRYEQILTTFQDILRHPHTRSGELTPEARSVVLIEREAGLKDERLLWEMRKSLDQSPSHLGRDHVFMTRSDAALYLKALKELDGNSAATLTVFEKFGAPKKMLSFYTPNGEGWKWVSASNAPLAAIVANESVEKKSWLLRAWKTCAIALGGDEK